MALAHRGEVGGSKIQRGLLNPRTMANHDSDGTGPKNRIMHRRRVAYWVKDLIAWMEEHASYIEIEEEVANA